MLTIYKIFRILKNRSKHSLTSSCVDSFSSFRLLSFVSKSGPRARRLMCVSAVQGRQVPLRLVGPLGVAAGKLFPGPHCHRVSYCVERNLRVLRWPRSSHPPPIFSPRFFPCTSPVPELALPSAKNPPCLAVSDLTAGEGIHHQTRPHQPEVFSRREARSPPSPSPPPTGAALAWTGDWRSIRARITSLAGE